LIASASGRLQNGFLKRRRYDTRENRLFAVCRGFRFNIIQLLERPDGNLGQSVPANGKLEVFNGERTMHVGMLILNELNELRE
jgi:hypothetical protein